MATTKKATKKGKKVEATNTVDNVLKTASSINKQVQYTANEVAKEVMENGKIVRSVAGSAAKELNKKVDFEDSVNKIKYTANNVNTELKNLATEVVDVVVKSGKSAANTVTKAAQDVAPEVDVKAGMKKAGSIAKKVNDYSLKTADEAIDGALKSSQKWQKVAEKAVNGGLKLAARNQDFVFATLEEVKGQVSESATRFRKLFSRN